MEKKYLIIVGVVLIVLIILAGVFLFLRSEEDYWMQNENGIWIKHGNPSEMPKEMNEQADAIMCASELYLELINSGAEINSQCLGVCGYYAVDIAHNPRTEEDNLIENQCEEFRNGNVNKFIEVDYDGKIVRVVEEGID